MRLGTARRRFPSQREFGNGRVNIALFSMDRTQRASCIDMFTVDLQCLPIGVECVDQTLPTFVIAAELVKILSRLRSVVDLDEGLYPTGGINGVGGRDAAGK